MEQANVTATAPEVKQESIVADFQEEIVNDYSYEGEEPEEPEETDIKDATLEQPKLTEHTVNTESESQAKDAPASQAVKDAPFDIDNFKKMADVELKYTIPEPVFEAVANEPTATVADDTPPWKKQLAERMAYRENIAKRMSSSLEYFMAAKAQGYDDNQAAAYAQSQINALLDAHEKERDAEAQYKATEENAKLAKQKEEDAVIKVKSDAAMAQVAAKFGGMQQLQDLLFKRELGGDLLLNIFHLQNDGKKYKDEGAYKDALNSWFTRFSSDANRLAWAARQGLANYTHSNRKGLIEYALKQNQATEASGKTVHMAGPNKAASMPQKKFDDVDMFLAPASMSEKMARTVSI